MSRIARRLLLASCLLLLVPAAPAADDSAERLRIARERVEVQKRFAAAERTCAERFAVTDCLDAARRERREGLLRLRREETLLDEARRKQRAAERMDTIRRRISDEEQRRSAAPKPPRDGGTPSAPRIRAREPAPAASEAVSGATSPLHRGRVTVREKAPPVSAAERAAQEARSRAAYDARQRAAQDHEAENRRRNEERAKGHKAAAPLPAPSGAAP